MLFAETADLIAQEYTVNSVGDSVPTETKHTVFVEFQSIGLKRKIEAMTSPSTTRKSTSSTREIGTTSKMSISETTRSLS